jgi:microcystin-dependent protein
MGFSFSDLTYNLRFIDNINLGYQPNKTNPGAHAIAIGAHTGIINQGTLGIAIGFQAAQYDQDSSAIAIGTSSGQTSQHSNAIAIGENAGQIHQKPFGIALGTGAGQNTQRTSAIAIGENAGQNNQGAYSIAIGSNAGRNNQEISAIALGAGAGQNNQGSYSIAIGAGAGQTNQVANSIVLNASGNPLNATTSGLFIRPIRESEVEDVDLLEYDEDTCEITEYGIETLVGDLKYSLVNVDHKRWLLCDGRSLSVDDYPQLFAAMGYSFGGSGSVFKLPDPQGRVLSALSSSRTLGENVGTETHTLTINEIPPHNHAINDPGHTHSYSRTNGDEITNYVAGPLTSIVANDTYEAINTSSNTTGISLGNTGGGLAHNIMQPTLFIGNLFIYADF